MSVQTCTQPRSELPIVDVGYEGYLSRYLVAGVALEALGTCKQCTHQATVICDNARGQPTPKLQVSLAPTNSTGKQTQSDEPTL